jgi:glycine hydroxymethyltransferase
VVDWARFRAIADKVGAYLFVDMAHVAGLVAAGVYPNPVPHAHVVTSTTHKTLRGPRGGIIVAKANEEIEKKLQSIVFPGIQGGPLMHVIAAKAVAFKEALEPAFKDYQAAGREERAGDGQGHHRARLQDRLGRHQNHLMLVDMIGKDVTGKDAERGAGQGPHHGQQELGAERPAQALRHLRSAHRHAGGHHARLQGERMRGLANWICDVLDAPERRNRAGERARAAVTAQCQAFPVYG